MKTKAVFLAILASAVLFGSCVGTKALGVLDESVPEEMRCDLEIRNNLSVVLFNNRPVEWAPGLSENKVTITLPPGNHTFGVRYYISRSVGYNLYETVPVMKTVELEFIPGHSYRIYKQDIWLLFITITNIKVKDVTPKSKT
jgi:hypothetical protein